MHPRVRDSRETRAAATQVIEIAQAAVTFAYDGPGSAGIPDPSGLERCLRGVYVGQRGRSSTCETRRESRLGPELSRFLPATNEGNSLHFSEA